MKKSTLKNQSGFTLIELVLIITLLGILAVAALPTFFNMTTNAATSARSSVVGAVRTAISSERASRLVTDPTAGFTAALDANAANGDCTTCFSAIMQDPITGTTTSGWSKGANTSTYVYTGGNPTPCTFVYTAASGTFTSANTACNP